MAGATQGQPSAGIPPAFAVTCPVSLTPVDTPSPLPLRPAFRAVALTAAKIVPAPNTLASRPAAGSLRHPTGHDDHARHDRHEPDHVDDGEHVGHEASVAVAVPRPSLAVRVRRGRWWNAPQVNVGGRRGSVRKPKDSVTATLPRQNKPTGSRNVAVSAPGKASEKVSAAVGMKPRRPVVAMLPEALPARVG